MYDGLSSNTALWLITVIILTLAFSNLFAFVINIFRLNFPRAALHFVGVLIFIAMEYLAVFVIMGDYLISIAIAAGIVLNGYAGTLLVKRYKLFEGK